jgi:hypothetical protein
VSDYFWGMVLKAGVGVGMIHLHPHSLNAGRVLVLEQVLHQMPAAVQPFLGLQAQTAVRSLEEGSISIIRCTDPHWNESLAHSGIGRLFHKVERHGPM